MSTNIMEAADFDNLMEREEETIRLRKRQHNPGCYMSYCEECCCEHFPDPRKNPLPSEEKDFRRYNGKRREKSNKPQRGGVREYMDE